MRLPAFLLAAAMACPAVAGAAAAAGTQAAAAAAPSPTASPASPADSSAVADRIVAASPVPDAARKVGDTRLVTRGDAVVVQTVLSTKLLARVLAEIRAKEERNWPDGQPGADDRRAYVEALLAAKETLDRRAPASPGWTDRRQRLLIEFVAGPSTASFTIATFDDVPLPDQPGPSRREVLGGREASRDYVLRNIRLIVADSFHVDEKDADRIGPLAPARPVKAAAPATNPAPAAKVPKR